ncbi:MAG: tellurite resistance/C4-dicarboxylate transporter family protein [Hyphomicrobiales bacterium]|nr:tellurite resistance/C4-dicarboxylate transporter family protein [Hyphomicrobiales bacterium]MDE2373512.1 tellurite resistance/C4-dicarboxylate transporter family protein [Hyphomicrobiales bacterium]
MSKPPSNHRRGRDEAGSNISIGRAAAPDLADPDHPRRQSRSAVRTIEAVWTVNAKRGTRGLSPAYFALVMATGIVSIAADRAEFSTIAAVLLWLNVGQFLLLWFLTSWRLLRYRRALFADFADHQKAPGFFSAVAATGVIGSQLVINGSYDVAFTLWIFAVFLWVILTYGIFTTLTIKETKPTIEQGITGTWLLAVVATQSIALLSALLARHLDQPIRLHVNFVALSMWLWGGMMYIWIISLIFYRYKFFKFSPADFSSSYWINMGAMAISTLAGSLLIENAADAWFLESLVPFLKGFTIFFWATGTWWIPMLIILFVWRHLYMRFPLRYDSVYWGMVFPLGMYPVCTFEMVHAMRLDFLLPIAHAFVYAALLAWATTFFGLVRSLVTSLIPALRAARGRGDFG